jgi:hypothetical protein
MKFKKIVPVIAISSAISLTLAACSGQTETNNDSDASSKNAPAGNSEKSQSVEPMDVTADELLNTLNENALKANTTYKDKYVRLKGRISGIDAQGDYFSVGPMEEDLSLNTIMCNIEEQHINKVMEFQTGQSVEVIGTVTDVGEVLGYTLEVESIESSVETSEANKGPEPTATALDDSNEANNAPQPVENNGDSSNSSSYDTYINEEVAALVTLYSYSLVDAINYNNFSLVESTLVPGSNLYNMQNKLVRDLNQRGISEEVVDFKVLDVSKGNDGKYRVNTYEKTRIYYSDGTSKVKEFYWTYDVVYNEMYSGLVDIRSTN